MSSATVSITASESGTQVLNVTGIPWSQGMSLRQALERGADDISWYQFALQYFGVEMYYVIALQWTFDANGFFWVYCVNGTPSPNAVDSQILNSGDEVEFVYRTFSAEERTSWPIAEAKYERAAAST